MEKLCKVLAEDVGQPICLTYKANVSIVNALWVLLVGERLDLHDKKLDRIVKALDDVLMSAQAHITVHF